MSWILFWQYPRDLVSTVHLSGQFPVYLCPLSTSPASDPYVLVHRPLLRPVTRMSVSTVHIPGQWPVCPCPLSTSSAGARMSVYIVHLWPVAPMSVFTRALSSTLSGTHLQDLGKLLSSCSSLVEENRLLYLVYESTVNQDTETFAFFLFKAGYKQTTFALEIHPRNFRSVLALIMALGSSIILSINGKGGRSTI